MSKERVLQRIKELKEYNEFKKNTVMIQIPYGLPNDNFKITAVITKEAFEQIQIYDKIMKEMADKLTKKDKEEEKVPNIDAKPSAEPEQN